MPQAVAVPIIAAAVSGGAAVGGAALASKGQGKAADAQSKANADALAFERDKETRRRSEYDAAMAEYRQRYADWTQQRTGLLSRYGVHPGTRPSLASFGPGPTASPMMGRPTPSPMMGAPGGGGGWGTALGLGLGGLAAGGRSLLDLFQPQSNGATLPPSFRWGGAGNDPNLPPPPMSSEGWE